MSATSEMFSDLVFCNFSQESLQEATYTLQISLIWKEARQMFRPILVMLEFCGLLEWRTIEVASFGQTDLKD